MLGLCRTPQLEGQQVRLLEIASTSIDLRTSAAPASRLPARRGTIGSDNLRTGMSKPRRPWEILGTFVWAPALPDEEPGHHVGTSLLPASNC